MRSGLCALPLILFLAGSLVVYFQPSRYQSTTVFQYLGNRPHPEVVALLKSRNVFQKVSEHADLPQRMGVSMETCFEIIAPTIKTDVDPLSGMIELSVSNTQKDLARDLAEKLPKALDAYETTLSTQDINLRLRAAEQSVTDAEDEAEMKRQTLAKFLAVRGDPPADPVAKLGVDAARLDWENAHRRVLEGRARVGEIKHELVNPGKWVVVHSQPVISDNSVAGESDETMGSVILESLGTGLAFALLVPYLLELAFPRRFRRSPAVAEKWAEFPGVPERI